MLLPRGRSFQLRKRDLRERPPLGIGSRPLIDAPFTVYRSYQSGSVGVARLSGLVTVLRFSIV